MTEAHAASTAQCKAGTNIFHNNINRCLNKAVRDGYCMVHHPDTVAARNEKKLARWEAEARERTRKWALERAAPEMFKLLDDSVMLGTGLAWFYARDELLDRIRKEMER